MKNSNYLNAFAVIFCTVTIGMAAFNLQGQYPDPGISKAITTTIMSIVEAAIFTGILLDTEGKSRRISEIAIYVAIVATIIITIVNEDHPREPIVMASVQGMASLFMSLLATSLIKLLERHNYKR